MKRPDPDAPVVQWAVYARSLEKENEELKLFLNYYLLNQLFENWKEGQKVKQKS